MFAYNLIKKLYLYIKNEMKLKKKKKKKKKKMEEILSNLFTHIFVWK